MSLSSSSIATTFFARLASSAVSTPIPGPISSTPESAFAPPISAILGHTEGFTRKFCPKPFENEKPCLCIIALIVPISDSDDIFQPHLMKVLENRKIEK
jgi:hypothetical protein